MHHLVQTPPINVLEHRGVPIKSWLAQLDQAGIVHQFKTYRAQQVAREKHGMLVLQKNPDALYIPPPRWQTFLPSPAPRRFGEIFDHTRIPVH